MNPPNTEGTLFVISAPSGTGKSTVAGKLVERLEGLDFSVSHTTRPPREDERDGRDYHFVDRAAFEAAAERGAFLEWACVYGRLYGTGLAETRAALRRGRDLLLDIDIQGARQVRNGPIPAVSMMIMPPDFQTLEARLTERGSEAESDRERRLAEARLEVEEFRNFDYVVVNDDLEQTVGQLGEIVRAERRRPRRCMEEAQRIIATFPS